MLGGEGGGSGATLKYVEMFRSRYKVSVLEKLKFSFRETIKLVTIIMSNNQKHMAVMDSKVKEIIFSSVGNWVCQQS